MEKKSEFPTSLVDENKSVCSIKTPGPGMDYIICIFILILPVLLISSCGKTSNRIDIINSDDQTFYKISVNPDKTDILKISSMAESIDYIIPESSHGSLFGTPDKVVFYDSLILISDTDNSMAIYCFSRSGKFILKINKSGKGPEEYIRLTDFAVDKYEKKLVIYDGAGRNLLLFDLNGSFLKKIRTGISADRIEITGKDRIMYYSDYLINPDFFRNTDYQILTCDYDNKLHAKFLPFPADENLFLNVIGIVNNTSSSENGCYIYPTFSNRIYSLEKDKIAVFAEFDFMDKNPPENFLASCSSREHRKNVDDGKYITGPVNFQVTANWLVAVIPYKKKTFYYVYNFKSGFNSFSAKIESEPDYPYFFLSMPPFFTDGTDLFCFIESYLVDKIKNMPNGNKILPEKLKNPDPNSNPIIQVIKLKR